MKKSILFLVIMFCISKSYSQKTEPLKPLDFKLVKKNMDSIFSIKKPFKMDLNIKNIDFENNNYTSWYNRNTVQKDNYPVYQSNTNYSNSILMCKNNQNIWGENKANTLNPFCADNIGRTLIFGTLNLILKKNK